MATSGFGNGLFHSCTLYVANLPTQATARDLARVFEPLTGRLIDCRVGPNGTGQLVCQRPDLAEQAYGAELVLFGRPIIVRLQPDHCGSNQRRLFNGTNGSGGYCGEGRHANTNQHRNSNPRRRNQPRNQHRHHNGAANFDSSSSKSASNLSEQDTTRLCVDTQRSLRLDSSSVNNANNHNADSPANNSLRCRRRALEQAVRERDLDKLKSAVLDWPGGSTALIDFCAGISDAGAGRIGFAGRAGAALPIVHDLVSQADCPSELLEVLIDGCCQGLDEPEATNAIKRLLNGRDQYGHTPLHRATRCGAEAAIEVLLNNGADVAAVTDRDRRSALHIHLWLGCGRLAYRLLDCGADPDAVDADNWTALHWCAKNAHLEFARHLIRERNVKLFRSPGSTLSPLKLCLQQVNQCANGHLARAPQQQQQQQPQHHLLPSLFSIARLLLRHGSDLPSQAFLSDWLVATQSVSWPSDHAAALHSQLVDLLALEGAQFVTDECPQSPSSLFQLCRLSVRSRLRNLTEGRSILKPLHRLTLPPRLLQLVDLCEDAADTD